MKTLRCSFCYKSAKEVRTLISGESAMICDECIEGCRDIIGEDRRGRAKELSLSKPIDPDDALTVLATPKDAP